MISKMFIGQKSKLIEFLAKKTDPLPFLKAFITFKMGVIIVPFTNEIIHKNVSFKNLF